VITLSKIALLAGLGFWLSIALLNNLRDFGRGVKAMGDLMAMRALDVEPIVTTSLTRNRVTSLAWHRVIFSLILIMEGLTAALLLGAAVLHVVTLVGAGNPPAQVAGQLAVGAFLALGGTMLVGGTWFAYHLKLPTVQLTHLTMLAVGAAAAVLLNQTLL
jgi:hypothetical protein